MDDSEEYDDSDDELADFDESLMAPPTLARTRPTLPIPAAQRQRVASYAPTEERMNEQDSLNARIQQIMAAPSYGTSSGVYRSATTDAYVPIVVAGQRMPLALYIPGEMASWFGIAEEGSYR